MEWVDRKNQT